MWRKKAKNIMRKEKKNLHMPINRLTRSKAITAAKMNPTAPTMKDN